MTFLLFYQKVFRPDPTFQIPGRDTKDPVGLQSTVYSKQCQSVESCQCVCVSALAAWQLREQQEGGRQPRTLASASFWLLVPLVPGARERIRSRPRPEGGELEVEQLSFAEEPTRRPHTSPRCPGGEQRLHMCTLERVPSTVHWAPSILKNGVSPRPSPSRYLVGGLGWTH